MRQDAYVEFSQVGKAFSTPNGLLYTRSAAAWAKADPSSRLPATGLALSNAWNSQVLAHRW